MFNALFNYLTVKGMSPIVTTTTKDTSMLYNKDIQILTELV